MNQLQKDIKVILGWCNKQAPTNMDFDERKAFNRLLEYSNLDLSYDNFIIEEDCEAEG